MSGSTGFRPIIVKSTDNEDRIIAISCENAFTVEDEILYDVYNITLPLSNPILSDIVINFDYDAYLLDDSDSNQALKDVEDNIFNSIVKYSPLLADDGFTITDATCDELLENTFESMLVSLGFIASSRSTNIADNEWNYYLGFNKEPIDVISSEAGGCASSMTDAPTGTTCKAISSSFIAQIPVNRELDTDMIKTQMLQHVKNGFEKKEYVTRQIPSMIFVGTRDALGQNPTNVIDEEKENGLLEKAAKLFTAFGVSMTFFLVLATSILCGIFFYKFKIKRDMREKNELSYINKEGLECVPQDVIEEEDLQRAKITQSFDDGVEIVEAEYNTCCGVW